MKSFGILKIAMVLVGLGAAFLLAPEARAQSEVSPDHFDGTDSWAVALAAKDAKAKPSAARLSAAVLSEAHAGQAQNNKASIRPVAARTVPQAPSAQVVTIQEKRKTSSAAKSQKQ